MCLRKNLPLYYNRHQTPSPYVFFQVIISQKRKAWWGLPALNHFLRNGDRDICDEDSLHNDSVLTRLTMRHERFLPSVSQENAVSIRCTCFLRLRRALLFGLRADERCRTLRSSKAFPALYYLRSEGEHDFGSGTIVQLYH